MITTEEVSLFALHQVRLRMIRLVAYRPQECKTLRRRIIRSAEKLREASFGLFKLLLLCRFINVYCTLEKCNTLPTADVVREILGELEDSGESRAPDDSLVQ